MKVDDSSVVLISNLRFQFNTGLQVELKKNGAFNTEWVTIKKKDIACNSAVWKAFVRSATGKKYGKNLSKMVEHLNYRNFHHVLSVFRCFYNF